MYHKGREEKVNAIVEAGHKLFLKQGYENTSVDDILQFLGISKGTFYHYFESKEALLDAIIQKVSATILLRVTEIADDPDINALEKLNQYFQASQSIKVEQKKLMLILMKQIYRQENLLFLHKMNRRIRSQASPILAKIIEQGKSEGVFDTADALETAILIITLGIHLRDRIVEELHLENPDFEQLDERVRIFELNAEKILGAPKGSLHMLDSGFFKLFAMNLSN